MFKRSLYRAAVVVSVALLYACVPAAVQHTANRRIPEAFDSPGDTLNTAAIDWRDFFSDPYLVSLIDTALKHNQELNITLQEIEIARGEVRERKGEYLPFVDVGVGAGIEKPGRYTHQGATDHATEFEPGKEMPEPLQDYYAGAVVSWEADIWKKLRNAKKAALLRYLSSAEGRNFTVTRLVSEIASSYYELLALDTELDILRRSITLQQSALDIVRIQKNAARVTELAVRKFEAEVLRTQSEQYEVRQKITETENRINYLLGRYPQPILRDPQAFASLTPPSLRAGTPAQLLTNRPDIRRAELELSASGLDVKVARASFYPAVGIKGGVGVNAFDLKYLGAMPESLIYSIAGDITAPLVNRNAIKARYFIANARQNQAAFEYERTVLLAYIEVVNQISNISNLQQNYDLKSREVDALMESISISNNLFRSARADYMEVLLTQRDAFESRRELVETRKRQMIAGVTLYQALGGGWNQGG